MRFTITTHRRLSGVALSLAGSWGGVRFDDDAQAVAAAREHAGSNPYSVEREFVK